MQALSCVPTLKMRSSSPFLRKMISSLLRSCSTPPWRRIRAPRAANSLTCYWLLLVALQLGIAGLLHAFLLLGNVLGCQLEQFVQPLFALLG